MKRWRIKGRDLTTAMEVWYESATTILKKPSEREILQSLNWQLIVSPNQRLEWLNSSFVSKKRAVWSCSSEYHNLKVDRLLSVAIVYKSTFYFIHRYIIKIVFRPFSFSLVWSLCVVVIWNLNVGTRNFWTRNWIIFILGRCQNYW